MPTPRQIAAVKRAAQEDPYFVVHEVVECVSEGEEGFGEEDLIGGSAQKSVTLMSAASSTGDAKSSPGSRRISQETFNAAVYDNMEEFDMKFEDAIAEAVEEFRLQGASIDQVDTNAVKR
mmetsp:Transcript_32055/g.65283  ORF Transcript_32055/g.65283 Transcript_32055/m.65283 type:complete len:120 (-) Transcript_32055:81-440(-)|eukprot:CAMPEP_0171636594 /NCGR_PEP_ID=MMETSP0990-20121206/27526_1 /TAXON_ID=483369 /ORGANISM="non described non described, Strain CCMP2098" /LENGTH=119 /DNA_ID=CAMNT_0012208801 /DNA_START=123 /DNA_END=482 /DNA_ORIENTATION=-